MAEKKRKAAGRQKWREWAESEEHQAVLSAWARAGMTDEEIAKQIGISRNGNRNMHQLMRRWQPGKSLRIV